MNRFTEAALYLAKKWEFEIIPIAVGKKDPPIFSDPYSKATTDPKQIVEWWKKPYNPAISTHRWHGGCLIAVDIDVKPEKNKNGLETLAALRSQGLTMPKTFTQRTSSKKGFHVLYSAETPVAGGTNVLGLGLDIRSYHNYVLGPGAVYHGGSYDVIEDHPIVPCPQWIIDMCNEPGVKDVTPVPENLDPKAAELRAITYLMKAPPAVAGSRRQQTYKTACWVRDEGVDEFTCLCLLVDHWNARNLPPLDESELQELVSDAYQYAKGPLGGRSPEADFVPVPAPILNTTQTLLAAASGAHPCDKYNARHAVMAGQSRVSIVVEGIGREGEPSFSHYSERDFKTLYKNDFLDEKQMTDVWLKSRNRRNVYGFTFNPKEEAKPTDRYVNLWRGFKQAPLAAGEAPSTASKKTLDDWLGHIHDNVLQDNPECFDWFIGYLAHLFQKPWEKPTTGLVLRGEEGTGKNAVFDRIRDLVGRRHYFASPRGEFVMGQFTAHLETLLMFEVGEAFYRLGDKQRDAIIKDLISNQVHNIRRLYMEAYQVPNYTRLVFLSNEECVIPASVSARRFFVTEVGNGRRQDTKFFGSLENGFTEHAAPLFMRFFLQRDLTGLDFNIAPKTKALREQKMGNLLPFPKWWADCLYQGRIVEGSDFANVWPEFIDRDSFRNAYEESTRKKGHRGITMDPEQIGKALKKICPSHTSGRHPKGDRKRFYKLPPLKVARQEFDNVLGHAGEWEPLDEELTSNEPGFGEN